MTIRPRTALVLLATAGGHCFGWCVDSVLMKALPSSMLDGPIVRLGMQNASASSNTFVPGKRWAIVIGAQDYSHFPKLRFARRDAETVHKLLIHKYGFSADSTKLLLDSGPSESRPTAGNIMGELEDLLQDKRLDKSDLFVFYFAGHGVGTANGDLLLPTDARPSTLDRLGLPTKEIVDKFTRAGLSNVLIIADACRSGRQNPFGKELVDSVRGTNLAVMLASGPGEPSYESAKLQHGYFTFELLRALEDESLLDPLSGALWVSKIAEVVSAKTSEASARDQGSYSQTPEAYQPRGHDILLFARPPKMFSGNAVNLFMEEANRISPENYGAVMNDIGAAMFEFGNNDGVVRVLESARRLGQATPRSLYQLGMALSDLSRELDSNEAYAEGHRIDPEGFYGLLCGVNYTGRKLSAGIRTVCAYRLWDLEQNYLHYLILDSALRSDPDRRSKLQAEALKAKLFTDKERAHIEAVSLDLAGDDDAAIAKYELALQLGVRNPGVILRRLHRYYLLRMDEVKCAEYEARIVADKPNDSDSYLVSARSARFFGRFDDALSLLQKSADLATEPDEMLSVLADCGGHIITIAPQFKEKALKFNRSWRADVVAMFSNIRDGDASFSNQKWADAKRYCDDPVEVALAAADVLGEVGNDFMRMSEEVQKSNPFFSTAFLCLLDELDSFGNNEYAWLQLMVYGMNAGRHYQLLEATRKLPKATSLGRSLEWPLWNLKANTLPLTDIPHPLDGGKQSPQMFAILVFRGEEAAVLELIKKLPKSLYDTNEITRSIHALALAKTGALEEARKIANSLENVTGVPALIMGLVHKELGEEKEAIVDFIVGTTTIDNLNWTFAYNEALRIWCEMIVDKDRNAVTRAAHEIYGDSPGLRIAYPGGGPVGYLKFDATVFLDFLNIDGEPPLALSGITLHITDNTVTGSIDSGSESHAIQGTIDDLGTVAGSFKVGTRQYKFSCRLPNVATLSNDPILKEHGVWFIAYDERLNKFAINAKYKESK